MAANHLFETAARRHGWDEERQLEILENYLTNQDDEAALADYLAECGVAEDDSDSERIHAMLDYINNQEADDTFADHLAEVDA